MKTGLPDSRKQTPLIRHDRHAVTLLRFAAHSSLLRGEALYPAKPGTPHRPVRGFTYIGLLILIALMGLGLAGTGMVWHTESRREKERDLLFAGDQIRRAIGLYYERTPGTKQFPQTLEDLLLDRRYPNTQRYLRRIYHDPLTSEVEWGLVRGPQGGIVGVHSLSDSQPFKQAGFRQIDEDFEGAERYKDWKFVYRPPETQNPASPAAAPAAGNTN